MQDTHYRLAELDRELTDKEKLYISNQVKAKLGMDVGHQIAAAQRGGKSFMNTPP